MTFSSDLKGFTSKTFRNLESIHDGTTETFRKEVTEGGTLTGAPGQPEDLRPKVQVAREDRFVSSISIDDPSAQSVEEGISHFNGHPITLHSPVGGFHSFKLAVAAGQIVVDAEAAKVNR